MHSNFPSQTIKSDNSFFYRRRQLPGRHLVITNYPSFVSGRELTNQIGSAGGLT
jgi:hypothetical protein